MGKVLIGGSILQVFSLKFGSMPKKKGPSASNFNADKGSVLLLAPWADGTQNK